MSNKVICIIDDDLIYQFLINKIISISKTGYDILYFKNGKDALDSFTNSPSKNLPEIILLDIEMPILDGWGFLGKIDQLLTENTAIYIVSSSISYEDKEKAKTFPKIKGYFSKPINSDIILEITKHLEK